MDFRLRINCFNNDQLNLWYINIFIFIFLIVHPSLVSLFVWAMFKHAYISAQYDSEELEFDFYEEEIEDEEFLYADQDVDSDYLDNFETEEDYLIFSCRYWFGSYGGDYALAEDDYYIVNNVYKNIYKSLDYNTTFNTEDKDSPEYINFIEEQKIACNYNFLLNDLSHYKYNIITHKTHRDKLLILTKKKRNEKIK